MEAMRQSWSDDRLDVLNEKVDLRFEQIDERFDHVNERFAQIDRRLGEMNGQVNGRFEETGRQLRGIDQQLSELRTGMAAVQRSTAFLAVGLTTAMLAGFAGMATVIAAVA
jgi:archaellum component FlaC